MTKQYNLKSIVDFLEANGYHVRKAYEKYSDTRYFHEHYTELDISKRTQETPLAVKGVLDFMTANGFTVAFAEEVYKDGPNPAYVSLIIVLKRGDDA
jgi:hypothetical protein